MRSRILHLLFLAISMLFLSTASFAQVGVSVRIAPPELPVYEQPICPGDGYIWTPGYWAWDGDYYWVPGTWVMAPRSRVPLDSRLLGLGRRRIPFQRRLLGPDRRFLWRDQLWLRILRSWL